MRTPTLILLLLAACADPAPLGQSYGDTDAIDEAISGDPADCSCGADVTSQLAVVPDAIDLAFAQIGDQAGFCASLYDVANGWDIHQFFKPRTQATGEIAGTDRGVGYCKGTVAIGLDTASACFRAEEVNYFLWGVLNRRCTDSGHGTWANGHDQARMAIAVFRTLVNFHDGADPAIPGRQAWFEAGWAADAGSWSPPATTTPEIAVDPLRLDHEVPLDLTAGCLPLRYDGPSPTHPCTLAVQIPPTLLL